MQSKFTSNFLQRHVSIKNTKYFSKKNKSHYEVLQLKRNCTAKQIKEQFIKLSKENHPDVNKSRTAHENFLQINEAYKVLSKADSRRDYDLGFPNNVEFRSKYRHVRPGRNPWMDPSFYKNRDKSQDAFHESQPYYGIKGVNRVSNNTIASLCVILATIIVALQFLAIKYSVTFKRQLLQKQSDEAYETLRRIKQEAEDNGNERQLEILKRKLNAK